MGATTPIDNDRQLRWKNEWQETELVLNMGPLRVPRATTRSSIAIEIALRIGLLVSESIDLISRLTARHVLLNTPRVKLPRERKFTSDGTVFIYIECPSLNKHGLIAIKDGSVTDIG